MIKLEWKIEEIVDKLLGIPYKHNGRSEKGLDCWGLVYIFFKELGVYLPSGDGYEILDDWYRIVPERYLNALKTLGEEVGNINNLQLLDIPYFRLYKNYVTHTGVMINNTYFIHVLIDKEVRVDNINRRFWKRNYAGARRLNIEL